MLHPSHLWLTIHESIGHSTELDRARGYEANYAGTTFVAPPDKVLNKLRFGKEFMNVNGNRTEPGALATVGWDDEGVPSTIVADHRQRFVRQLPDNERTRGMDFRPDPRS